MKDLPRERLKLPRATSANTNERSQYLGGKRQQRSELRAGALPLDRCLKAQGLGFATARILKDAILHTI